MQIYPARMCGFVRQTGMFVGLRPHHWYYSKWNTGCIRWWVCNTGHVY